MQLKVYGLALQLISTTHYTTPFYRTLYKGHCSTGCQGHDWNRLAGNSTYTVKYQHEYILTDFLGTVRLRAILQRPPFHRLPLTH